MDSKLTKDVAAVVKGTVLTDDSGCWTPNEWFTDDDLETIGRSVVNALAPKLAPVVPEGWRLEFVDWERYANTKGVYVVRVEHVESGVYVQTTAPKWEDAMVQAIAKVGADHGNDV